MRAEIRAAVWAYRTAAGRRRLAYFGDVVDLTEAEYARAEQAGVFAPEVADEPVVVFSVSDVGDLFPPVAGAAPDESDQTESEDPVAVPRPASTTSPKAEWHAYAVSRGISAEEAGRMTRAEIAARLPEA